MKIFNASGHAITQPDVEVVGVAAVPNADMASYESVVATAQAIAEQVAEYAVNGVLIALPGHSALASHVLALLHGLTGSWPRIAWSARTPDGRFVWTSEQTSDLYELRNLQRERGPLRPGGEK